MCKHTVQAEDIQQSRFQDAIISGQGRGDEGSTQRTDERRECGETRGGRRASLEVIPLDLERAPVREVALHDFHHGLWKAHAQQGPLDFGVSMDLAQLEEATSDLGRVLT